MSTEIAAPAQEGTATPAVVTLPVTEEVTSGTTGATPQAGAPSADAPGEKREGARERIEELVAQNKAYREYGEFYRQRFEEFQRQPPPAAAAPVVEQPDPEPNADDFDDPKAYTKAYTTWSRKQIAKEVAQATEQARTEGKTAAEKAYAAAREKERLKGLDDQFTIRSQQFAERNPNYWTVIGNPALTFMNGEFLEAIKSSEKGPELALHIASDPKLVAQLASKSVPQRLTQLGRIEAELSRPPPPPKVTAAPAPPTPIGGGAGGEVDPSKLSTSDWIARRTAEIRAKRSGR
jgi:hypothetical protein